MSCCQGLFDMTPQSSTMRSASLLHRPQAEDVQEDHERNPENFELKSRSQTESSRSRPRFHGWPSFHPHSHGGTHGDTVGLSAGPNKMWPDNTDNGHSINSHPQLLHVGRGSGQPSVINQSRSIPESFYNLDEVAIPDPVENPDELPIYRHHSLEEQPSRERRVRHELPPDLPSPLEEQDAEKGTGGPWPNPQGIFTSRAITELSTVSYLIFFSILGTLSRLGLEALTSYPGAPIASTTLWVNFAGSLFLGFLAESSERLNGTRKKNIHAKQPEPSSSDSSGGMQEGEEPAEQMVAERQGDVNDEVLPRKPSLLYIGLSTGFCGSFTTFSSFARDVFLFLSNGTVAAQPSRTIGEDVVAALAVMITTLSLCLAAVKVGAHIAILVGKANWVLPGRLHALLNRAILIIGVGTWAGAIIMTVLPPDRLSGPSGQGAWEGETWRGLVLFAIVFAPMGCLARFYLSVGLNGIQPSFPIGTFAANIIGTIILGIAWDIQRSMRGNSRISCQALQGVMDGFCGCLTTVSTWVAELGSLRRRHAYVYGMVTLGASLALLILIMGSQKWSTGWTAPACSVVG